jgi:hypothetical protein
MSEESKLGVVEADLARAELYDTLGQLRERLDYAKRVDRTIERASRRIAASKRENPAAFASAVVGVAAVCGLAAWGVTRKILQAFE